MKLTHNEKSAWGEFFFHPLVIYDFFKCCFLNQEKKKKGGGGNNRGSPPSFPCLDAFVAF